MRRLYSHVVIAAICLAAPLAAVAQAQTLPVKQSNAGQVTVSVKPLALSRTENWRFEVEFNSHVSPITQDIAAVSVISDGSGRDEKPVAWQGDPPGGHHRKGILLFKPLDPRPDSITLKIQQIGSVPERAFTWKLSGE